MSDLGNKEVFSKNLKRYMDLMDITRADLADKMGVAYSTINDWYNGDTYPRIDSIEWLADYFKIKKSDLIENPSNNLEYYLDPEARELAQLMSERKDLRMLLSAARDISPEDVEMVNNLVESLRRKEKGY